GNGLPLPGTPAWEASIIVGLARIAFQRSSGCALETSCQLSYPLKSENGSPLGTCSVYLSCAERAAPPRTAPTAVIAAASLPLPFIVSTSEHCATGAQRRENP